VKEPARMGSMGTDEGAGRKLGIVMGCVSLGN
jgi:hypothetical protein